MFGTIVIGYDGPGRGGDAVALGEVLLDPRKGSLLLASSYSLAPAVAGGFVVPEEVDALRDDTERRLIEARAALPHTDRVPVSYTHLTLPTTPYV